MREDFDFRYSESLLSRYNPELGREMRSLWQEYEEGNTLEAKAVKQLDKFDLLVTLLSYEARDDKDYLDSFADVVAILTSSNILPEIRSWVDILLRERTKKLFELKNETPVIFFIGMLS